MVRNNQILKKTKKMKNNRQAIIMNNNNIPAQLTKAVSPIKNSFICFSSII